MVLNELPRSYNIGNYQIYKINKIIIEKHDFVLEKKGIILWNLYKVTVIDPGRCAGFFCWAANWVERRVEPKCW